MVTFILLLFLNCQMQDIRNTNYGSMMIRQGELYVGLPSSSVESQCFLKRILYGRPDAPFSNEQIFKSLMNKTNEKAPGNIVIENNYVNSAIITDNESFIYPIIGSQVVNFPIAFLPRYFGKGYTIFETKKGNNLNTISLSVKQGLINNTNICNECSFTLKYQSDFPEIFLNSFWYISIASKMTLITIEMNGFVSDYDDSSKEGKVKLVMISSQYPGKDKFWELLDEDGIKEISFNNKGSSLALEISTSVDIGGYDSDLYIKANT